MTNGCFVAQKLKPDDSVFRLQRATEKFSATGIHEATGRRVNEHVSALNAARIGNLAVDESTARWLDGVDGLLLKKLVDAGLLDDKGALTLGPFLNDYLRGRQALVRAGKLDPSSLQIEDNVCDSLLEFFKADTHLRKINEGSTWEYRNWLLTQGSKPAKVCGGDVVIFARKGLAESTTRKHCSIASKIFGFALKKELIKHNPFDDVPKANIGTNVKARITTEDAVKVINELPNTEWKLLFALSRWGGLRVGSEPRRLRWSDILWDENKILVHSHKTRRYAGHETRLIPLFPELASLLERRFEEGNEGEDMVLPFLAGRRDSSLRKTMFAAIGRAGVKQWKRLWHSMRKVRQNELERKHPTHVVCYWLGNSKPVANKFYLEVTEEDYHSALSNTSADYAKSI